MYCDAGSSEKTEIAVPGRRNSFMKVTEIIDQSISFRVIKGLGIALWYVLFCVSGDMIYRRQP